MTSQPCVRQSHDLCADQRHPSPPSLAKGPRMDLAMPHTHRSWQVEETSSEPGADECLGCEASRPHKAARKGSAEIAVSQPRQRNSRSGRTLKGGGCATNCCNMSRVSGRATGPRACGLLPEVRDAASSRSAALAAACSSPPRSSRTRGNARLAGGAPRLSLGRRVGRPRAWEACVTHPPMPPTLPN